jgi:mono/diheme cytochrome c family protein
VVAWALVASAIVWSTPLAAQATDAGRLWQGVFTTAQAERGKGVYSAYCTRCHGLDLQGGQRTGSGPALAGDAFWQTWERNTLAGLYRKVSGQMPADAPASMRDNEYIDAVAYILASNGLPPGRAELTSDAAALDAVRIVKAEGLTEEEPNFSAIQVVGCLSEADGQWQLTRERETFRLLGAKRFSADLRAGTRVDVRGLVNRRPQERLLDVLALSPLEGTCG